jgi:cytochrome c2
MPTLRSRAAIAVAVLAVLVVAACLILNQAWKADDVRGRAEALTGGNVERERLAFADMGCGGCHTVGGASGAHGLVGPPLDGIAVRAIIAGKLANNPSNLERWISTPQAVVPGNAMPDMPMTDQQGRDIAAFLYTRT